MAKFTCEVFADWNADGDYTDATEDLTDYVTSLTYSHTQNLDTEQVTSGVVDLTLDNYDHRFSKPKGTITGLQPGRTLWARVWYPFDTFVGTNDTNLSAHTLTQDSNWTWVAASNNFQLNGSGAARTSTTDALHVNYLEFSDSDVEIAAQYRRGTDSSDHGGLLFRYVDANNYGYLRITGSVIEFGKVIGGTDSQFATKSYTWGDNDTKLLQLRLHGTTAVVLVDGVQIAWDTSSAAAGGPTTQYHQGEQSVSDAAINAGTKHGLFCEGAADHTWLQFGGFKSLLHGFIESIVPRPAQGSQYAYIKAHDDISEQQKTIIHYTNLSSANMRIEGGLYLGINSIGWRSRYQMDECAAVVKSITFGFKSFDMNVQAACLQAQVEEDGLFYVDGDGYTRLESRTHREGAPHTTSKITLTEDKNGTTPFYSEFSWDDGDSGIENRNQFVVTRGIELNSGSHDDVWKLDIDATNNAVQFDASEVREFEYQVGFEGTDYTYASTHITPAATTDYTANTAADGTGTNLTSQITVADQTGKAFGKFGNLKVTWGGTAGYLTLLKQRANPYKLGVGGAMQNEDTTSITSYRDRLKVINCLWHDQHVTADDVGAHRLARRKDPKTRLTLTLMGSDKVTAHHMMQRRMSDLVTVTYSAMGVNDTFFIEGESWAIDDAGFATIQTLQLREA